MQKKLFQESIPPLTDELFLSYSETGSRKPSENRIHLRGRYFTNRVYAECIENKGRFLPAIEKAILDICEQKTWLYPAHDPRLKNFHGECSETGICAATLSWNLSNWCLLVERKISPATKKVLAENFEKRTFANVELMVKTGKPRVLLADG